MMGLWLMSCWVMDGESEEGNQAETITINGFEVPSRFDMGCTLSQEPGCESDETVHSIILTHSIEMDIVEVTQGVFEDMMGYNSSSFDGCADCPVEEVSWHEAAAYANARSMAEGLEVCYRCSGVDAEVDCSLLDNPYTCAGYRLPTEAEWEASARCGTDFKFAGSDDVDSVAWYYLNTDGTQSVGQLASNACGLFDMSGNVWEWVGDWYGPYGTSGDTFTDSLVDPQGNVSGSAWVIRGGGWDSHPVRVRVANRSLNSSSFRYNDLGFRLSRTIP